MRGARGLKEKYLEYPRSSCRPWLGEENLSTKKFSPRGQSFLHRGDGMTTQRMRLTARDDRRGFVGMAVRRWNRRKISGGSAIGAGGRSRREYPGGIKAHRFPYFFSPLFFDVATMWAPHPPAMPLLCSRWTFVQKFSCWNRRTTSVIRSKLMPSNPITKGAPHRRVAILAAGAWRRGQFGRHAEAGERRPP